MAKILFINPEKCVGCMSCILACSLQQGNLIGPAKSKILPVRLKKQIINIPSVCRQCLKPLCADACPMGAISKDDKTRAVRVDPDSCIACGMCMTICPIGGISVDSQAGHAVKCELCGGDPLCVKFCGYGALEYIEEAEAHIKIKKEGIEKLAHLLERIATQS
jgi:Fe-S-cluster-containing hydrogenase component 2